MPDTIRYIYGVIPAGERSGTPPPGIDGEPVAVVTEGDLSALVAHLDSELYSPVRLEASSGDIDWVSPRAVAHDQVVTWAGDGGPVIPFPMWALYKDDAGIRAMLTERAPELRATIERVSGSREYAVRVFVRARELLESIRTLSSSLDELERAAESASPGQKYLLQRKIAGERERESRLHSRKVANATHDSLAAASLEAVRQELPRESNSERGRAILYSAFLVRDESLDVFRAALTALVTEHRGNGFHFDFTGPWPPYNFVRPRND